MSGGRDGSVWVWNPATGRGTCVLAQGAADSPAESAAVNADGSAALVGAIDGAIRGWNPWGSGVPRVMARQGDLVRSVAVSADGRHAISTSRDGTVRMWELPAGTCLHTLYDEKVWSVAASSDATVVVSAKRDTTLRGWVADWEYDHA